VSPPAAQPRSAPKPRAARRRTQEERSASTRERLLDATIESLVEVGYAGTSTTAVCARAGLSRGAQLHHYPTKADLVIGAVGHLAKRRAAELVAELPRSGSADERLSRALDAIWASFSGALFSAALEPRIRAAMVSGYLNTFRDSVFSLSHCIDNYVPGILNWAEMYDIAGLIAPRPLFAESGERHRGERRQAQVVAGRY